MVLTTLYLGRVLVRRVWGGGGGVVLEGQDLYGVVPRLVMGCGAVVGGVCFQSWVFALSRVVIVLEGGFLVLVWVVGVCIVLVWSVGGEELKKREIRRFSRRRIIPLLTMTGMCWRKTVFDQVDLGWNESVFGGGGVFNCLLELSGWLLEK